MGLSQWLAAGCHGVGVVEVASVGTDQVEGGDEVDRGGLFMRLACHMSSQLHVVNVKNLIQGGISPILIKKLANNHS